MQLLYEFIKEDLRPFIHEAREYIRERRNCREQTSAEPEKRKAAEPLTPASPTDEPLYNRKEAAVFLMVDPRTVTRYRLGGKLRFVYNEDSKIRYREDDLSDCYFWKWGKRP